MTTPDLGRIVLLEWMPFRRMRTWLGTEGGYERVIFQTGGYLRFYLTVKAFGWRVRLFGRRPFARVVRA